MNKKKLYLHIGMGKTGTTALQNFFWSNRDLLASKGIYYPSLGVMSGAHHLLSPHIPPFLKNIWEFIEAETWAPQLARESYNTLLLSSELMAWCKEDLATRFCETIKIWFQPKIIIYLRRQDNLIMAGYNQQIKAGTQKRDIHTLVEHQLDKFNYEKKLAPWVSALGEKNIIVRPYERRQFYGDDIRNDFLQHVFALELSKNFNIDKKNSNPRLSFSAMEYKRLLNNLISDMTVSSSFNDPLHEYSNLVDKTSSEIYSNYSLLSPAVRQEILRKCEPVNSLIARKYLSRSDGKLFYDPIPEDHESWKQQELSMEEIKDISHFISQKAPLLMDKVKTSIKEANISGDLLARNAAKQLSLYF